MTEIKLWVIKICTAVIFIILCDMLVPKKFKNVCNMVLGILMILVIVSPIQYLTPQNINSKILKNNNFLNKSSIYINKDMLEAQDKNISQTYEKTIEQQLQASIMQNYHLNYVEVKLDSNFDKDNKFTINKIFVDVKKNGEASKEVVKEIKIKVGPNYNDTVSEAIDLKLESNIKNYVSEFLKIDKKYIVVNFE